MNSVFQVGDRVRVRKGVTPHGGRIGVVTNVEFTREWRTEYWVMLDLMSSASLPHVKHYSANELAHAVGRASKESR